MPRTKTPSQPRRRQAAPTVHISTYPNAVRYLLDRVDYERMRLVRKDRATFKLQRMKSLMEALGDLHEQVKMVHVAGTVGKGSTVAMLASMLKGCGYVVGQYTSPHVTDIRERISVNGKKIGKLDFSRAVRRVARAARKLDFDPTFFEFNTAMAFLYFAEEAVDIAVIETGLGGRLDSTNIITPLVSLITQIDFDHTQFLGDTLEKIAAEKAGILKRGVPAISCGQHRDVESVLTQVSEKVRAPIKFLNRDVDFSYRFSVAGDLGPHTRVSLSTATSQFMHLPVPLAGEHQAINCALALAAIDELKRAGFSTPELGMHEGLSKTRLPGRMEVVWDRPRILVDGAHNAVALAALMRSVGTHVPYDSMVCIFGCCEDKDIRAMLEKVALGGDKIIFTRAKGTPRAADPHELQRRFAECSGKMSQVARTLPEALDQANRAVGRDDLICITGSFYLVGEAKKHLAELRKNQTQADA